MALLQYGEHYLDLEDFHQQMVHILAKPNGTYSFFNGLAPDNIFFHGVACQCVQLQLSSFWVWIASSCPVRFKSRTRCGRAFVEDTGTVGTRTTCPGLCGTPISCLPEEHPNCYKIRHQERANWLTAMMVSQLATEGRAWKPSSRRPLPPTESGTVLLRV
jgi:hypothetical protein